MSLFQFCEAHNLNVYSLMWNTKYPCTRVDLLVIYQFLNIFRIFYQLEQFLPSTFELNQVNMITNF